MDWLRQGERDLEKARVDLEHGYYEWACFTSQQASEKAVKALAMYRGLTIWGHSLLEMLRVLEREGELPIPEDLKELAKILDKLYIPTRDPNGFPWGNPSDYYTQKDALEAINAAERIMGFCKGLISG